MLRQILLISRRRARRRVWSVLEEQERAFNTNDLMVRRTVMKKVCEIRKFVGDKTWLEAEQAYADYKERTTDENTKDIS